MLAAYLKRTLCFGLAFLAIGMSLASCTRNDPAEQAKVKEAVVDYNNKLIRTYLEANINYMYQVATDKQVSRVLPSILGLRATDNLMRAEQKTFEVKDIKVEKDKATLDSKEHWVYWWENRDTLKVTKPKKELTYSIRYHLVKVKGAWKVDKLEDIE